MNDTTVQRTAGAGFAYSPWRHGYAVFMAVSILVLICSGGLVTTKGAGLAVPDWPYTFGYNMFLFPVSRWQGAVALEHVHRLLASGIGFLSIVLAAWFWRSEPRRWVRNLAYLMVFAVVMQGVFGGLRVVLRADWIGVPHALLAQAFFALVAFVALTQSRWWQRLGQGRKDEVLAGRLRPLRRHVAAVTVLIFMQLGLGAAMRHAHAGLSILDFPKAYGHWWPQVHKADMPALNTERTEVLHMPATTLGQIHLQMTHRLMAALIFAAVIGAAVIVWRRRALLPAGLRWMGWGWPLALSAQVTLGMYVIWSGKAADVATAHVAVGATSLVWGVVLYAALRRWSAVPAFEPVAVEQSARVAA